MTTVFLKVLSHWKTEMSLWKKFEMMVKYVMMTAVGKGSISIKENGHYIG